MLDTVSKHGVQKRPAPRRFPIYRPHWNERPEELLEREILSEAELDWIRIAKDNNKVIAAYTIEQLDTWNFSLVSLSVAGPYREQGLGRWMLFHAVGLIESKGGRVVHVRCAELLCFVKHAGFSMVSSDHYVLDLNPE